MSVDLELYRIFYCVAKCGSVSAAAQELYISQPAVSQSVKQLEQALGCRLFVRTSKGVRLTAEGEVLFPFAERGCGEFAHGEKLVREMLDLDSGEIRIGASDMTLRFYLLPFLEEFHRRYPGVKIRVSNAPTPETLAALKAGKIDFGAVSTPISGTDGISCTKVGEIQDIFVAGEKFAQLKDRVLDVKELADYPLICLEKETSSTRRSMDAFMEENGLAVSPEIELATSELIVRFAERNLGIGAVADRFAEEAISCGKLFRVRLSKEMPKRSICIAANDKMSISAAGEKFLKEILGQKNA